MKNATLILRKDTNIAESNPRAMADSDAVDVPVKVTGDFTGVEPGADAVSVGRVHANDPQAIDKQPKRLPRDDQADAAAEHDPRVVHELTADDFFKLGKFRI